MGCASAILGVIVIVLCRAFFLYDVCDGCTYVLARDLLKSVVSFRCTSYHNRLSVCFTLAWGKGSVDPVTVEAHVSRRERKMWAVAVISLDHSDVGAIPPSSAWTFFVISYQRHSVYQLVVYPSLDHARSGTDDDRRHL